MICISQYFIPNKDDGTPEWYTSLAQLEDGILNINLDGSTLQRFNYDYLVSPIGTGAPNIVDSTVGTNILSIDFNSDGLMNPQICNDGINRGTDIAIATWQLGSQQDASCASK